MTVLVTSTVVTILLLVVTMFVMKPVLTEK